MNKLLLILVIAVMVCQIPITFGETIGNDKHISSNSSIVINFNNTLTTSGVFLNYTNGFVSFKDAKMNGINSIAHIGIKPSTNITILKIGDYTLYYATNSTSLNNKVWNLVGMPIKIINGNMTLWDNTNKIATYYTTGLNVEIIWSNIISGSSFGAGLFIGGLMCLMLIVLVIATRRKR